MHSCLQRQIQTTGWTYLALNLIESDYEQKADGLETAVTLDADIVL